jgi:hypothetical protein
MKENTKAMLASAEAAKVELCYDAAEELLQKKANLVGFASGVKWKNGEPTGEPALIFLVDQKLTKDAIRKGDMLPAKLKEMQTDVMSVGTIFAGGAQDGADALTLARRVRPVNGGYSVGHKNITAGTIATCVYPIQPGGTVSPPAHGIGIPNRYFILSNNHVLANVNNASIGDAILQPGPIDGGVDPADRIATLSAFIPIQLTPVIPLGSHNNLVDAAIATAQFHDIDREIYWSGPVQGWRRKALVTVGTPVKKTGRTTNFTLGRITGVNATVDVNFGGGRVGRFKDQILTTNMSAGGDSGSLITTLDNVAVGLLFAGSSSQTIANQIENVRALLKVEVADRIL